ncbi:NAD(P)-dependent alcohol dehydrogenase [Carboxylicivirga sp. M1479]|uniref:NAD(P)-dependent alcohol dehydrogenase n=1 Tax=Carboxylicivirga sp. M1479 TaxID=2594476 RepID=UPI0011785F06|nr:NAD(P)-dependent alcohol dehydrogenase [Carboxylicivirga sp. M1479]TRX71405.1 NAD(P)-dependent alcohol dehydrogenase [Carboxylicivirga sp. M1479]
MKAVICTQYGGPEVLSIQEVTKPKIENNKILVKVIASSITRAESMMRQGTPKFARLFLGFKKPKAKITGTGFAGIVEEVGDEVNKFSIGDNVFGETTLGFGTNAEYISIAENGLIKHKPHLMEFTEAATLCDGAVTAINFLHNLVDTSQVGNILINGASGSIGTAAIQIAQLMNWTITAVCSGTNAQLVKSLGADRVIDYTKEDFTAGMESYDLVFDTIGKSSFSKCRAILKPQGTYLSPVLSLSLLAHSAITSFTGRKKAKFCATGLQPVNVLTPLLEKLIKWSETGKYHTVIEKIYPMDKAKEAHQHVDTGHKKGNIVLLHNSFS